MPAAEGARPYSSNTLMEEVGEAGPCGRLLYATAQAIARRQALVGAKGLGEEDVALKMCAEGTRAMPLRGYQLFGNGALPISPYISLYLHIPALRQRRA